MSNEATRREFIKNTSAISAAVFVGSSSITWKPARAANERIRFACVGIGGKGSSDSSDAGRNGDVVAICDVDSSRLAGAQKKFKKAKAFTDYRKMIDEMKDNVDAVTVSTPDHNHAPASALAIKAGKHCFTQKPMTHSIFEARRLGELAVEHKVQTMMGNQGTANSKLREGAAIVQAGTLGTVTEVHIWTNRPVWPQGGGRGKPADVPKNLDWDLWLGPAPKRPFSSNYHPFAWRGWWDFGTGALGDMACHTFNMPFMALNLRDPIAVTAEHSGHNKDSYPKSSKIVYEFPAIGKRPAVKVVWYDGGNKPTQDLLPSDKVKVPNTGSLIVGDKGVLLSPGDYGGVDNILLPEGEIKKPDVEYEKSPGHFEEFARAISEGKPATSNFPDYAGPLTETILLGNLAVWAGNGVRVEWDAKNLKSTNLEEETAGLVKRAYRDGWETP